MTAKDRFGVQLTKEVSMATSDAEQKGPMVPQHKRRGAGRYRSSDQPSKTRGRHCQRSLKSEDVSADLIGGIKSRAVRNCCVPCCW
jgi:hypothetical protein